MIKATIKAPIDPFFLSLEALCLPMLLPLRVFQNDLVILSSVRFQVHDFGKQREKKK